MSLTGSFVVFVILWWLILFMILPRDINSQKRKICYEGTEPGAPTNPRIIKTHNNHSYYLNFICDHLFLNYFDILNIRRILSTEAFKLSSNTERELSEAKIKSHQLC